MQMMKNVLKLWRNLGGVLFQLILPILQITLFNFALGGNPHHLKMVVLNQESNCTQDNLQAHNHTWVYGFYLYGSWILDCPSYLISPCKSIRDPMTALGTRTSAVLSSTISSKMTPSQAIFGFLAKKV